MKNQKALFTELTLFLVILLLLETIVPFISLLFTHEKELVFMLAGRVFNPLISILIAIYLSKAWRIRLPFNFIDLFSSKFAWVVTITVLYFIVIFPFSFPVDFSRDFLSGMIQLPVFKPVDFTDRFSLWLFLSSVVIAPVVEEILFRGIIQKRIGRDFSPLVSIVIASIVFAISHFNPARLIRTFLSGLLLGAVYQKYKSLSLSISAHALINLLAFLFIRTSVPEMNQLALYFIVFLISVFFLLLANKKLKLIG